MVQSEMYSHSKFQFYINDTFYILFKKRERFRNSLLAKINYHILKNLFWLHFEFCLIRSFYSNFIFFSLKDNGNEWGLKIYDRKN